MAMLKVAKLTLSLDFSLLDFNHTFTQLFTRAYPDSNNIDSAYANMSTLTDLISYDDLSSIRLDKSQSFMLLRNNTINNAKQNNALLFLYAIVEKSTRGYSIRLVNWLNWIHNIHASLEHSYSFVSELNNTVEKDDFAQISDASCFKAFYPLVTYVPDKFRSGINRGVLFDIMHLFVKQRHDDKLTKDYQRNVYSRVRTSLKKDFNLDAVDIADLVKNDKFVTLKYGDDIHIPNTTITKNISQPVPHDKLLLSVMDSMGWS